MGKKTRGTIRESVRAGAQARGDSGSPSSPSDNDPKKPCEWCGASPGEYFLLAADGTSHEELICDDCATSFEKWMASESPPSDDLYLIRAAWLERDDSEMSNG